MKTSEIESDAIVLLRLARAYLADAVSVHIDRTGIAITVASDEAARRITEPHGMRRVTVGGKPSSSMVRFWAGTVGEVCVTVRIEDAAAQQGRAVA